MTDATQPIRDAISWVRSAPSARKSATTWKSCESYESDDVHITGRENYLIAIVRQQPNNGDFEARCDGTHNYLARYIAACNPATMIELIARLDAAEKDSKRLDAIDSQMRADGYEDTHMGNRWLVVEGAFSDIRAAADGLITAAMKKQAAAELGKQGGAW